MKKHSILYLLPLFFFFLSAFLLYEKEKKSVAVIINNSFVRELPHLDDSIEWMKQRYMSRGGHDNEWYKRIRETGHHTYIMQNPSNPELIDTIYINRKFSYSPNVLQYFQKANYSISLSYFNRCYLNIMDSLWNESLKRANIDAETSIIVGIRQLKEMFPSKDSFNVNASVTYDTCRLIDFNSAFCTDSVILGIQNHGTFKGYAHVSPPAVIKRMMVPYIIIAVFVLLYLLLPPLMWLQRIVVYRRRYIVFVGDAILYTLDNEIIYGDGSRKKLGVNEFAILANLCESGHLSTDALIKKLWPASDSVAGIRSFNVSFSKLNAVLKSVKRVTLSRDEQYVSMVDSTTLRERLSLFAEVVRMYSRSEPA
jgi:hypothetical protein